MARNHVSCIAVGFGRLKRLRSLGIVVSPTWQCFLVRLKSAVSSSRPDEFQVPRTAAVNNGRRPPRLARRVALLTAASTVPVLLRPGDLDFWVSSFSHRVVAVLRRRGIRSGCALMSGLRAAVRRWPSWVCAYVSGTILAGVLEAH